MCAVSAWALQGARSLKPLCSVSEQDKHYKELM